MAQESLVEKFKLVIRKWDQFFISWSPGPSSGYWEQRTKVWTETDNFREELESLERKNLQLESEVSTLRVKLEALQKLNGSSS